MRLSNKRSRTAWASLTIALAVATSVLPSCASGLANKVEPLLTTFNPCGTVFDFCEPEDIDILFDGYTNYDLDPTCSVAYYGADGDAVGTCGTGDIYD